jgi:hypothetical protein
MLALLIKEIPTILQLGSAIVVSWHAYQLRMALKKTSNDIADAEKTNSTKDLNADLGKKLQ